jgi:hypothetical protein
MYWRPYKAAEPSQPSSSRKRPITQILSRYAPILLTIGLVGWLELFVTIEWTYPYCTNPTDGEARPAFGMPFPYSMPLPVSLEYSFMPLAYVLNLAVLCLLVFPAVRWLLERTASLGQRPAIGGIGCLLFVALVGFNVLLLAVGGWRPVFLLEPYDGSYSDFRPVRFGVSPAAVCTPSRFWFPKGWRTDQNPTQNRIR